MLHFLLGTALCLFIGERLVRYWGAWRLRRATKRGLAMLHPTAPGQSPENRWLFPVFVCLAMGVLVAAATMH